jgi:hypothetical protein
LTASLNIKKNPMEKSQEKLKTAESFNQRFIAFHVSSQFISIVFIISRTILFLYELRIFRGQTLSQKSARIMKKMSSLVGYMKNEFYSIAKKSSLAQR